MSILLLLMVFIIFVYSLSTTCDHIKEPWVNYQQIPYVNIYTGAGNLDYNSKGTTPIGFYDYISYRRPYNGIIL